MGHLDHGPAQCKGRTAQQIHNPSAVLWIHILKIQKNAVPAQQIFNDFPAFIDLMHADHQFPVFRHLPVGLICQPGINDDVSIPDMSGAIDRFVEQKLRGREPDQKELQRVIGALQRRGYGWEEIRSALGRYQEGLDPSFYD